MKELIKQVEEFASEMELNNYYDATAMHFKYLNEVGKTAQAILNTDEVGIKNGFGRIAVSIIILAKQMNCELTVNFENQDNMRTFHWFMDEIKHYSVHRDTLDYLNDVSSYYGYSIEVCLKSALNQKNL